MSLQKRNGRKLLISYLITYLAVLVIPVAAALFCFSESTRTIQTDIENENRALLRQAVNMLDVPLRDLNAFGVQMVNSGAVASLRYVDDPLEYPNIQYFFRVQNTFPVSASTSNFLFDYFLMFNRGQLAANDRFAYSYDDFYALYMHDPSQSLEAWKEEMKNLPLSGSDCRLRHVIYENNGSPVDMTVIEFSYPFLPFANHDGRVLLLVDQSRLTGLLSAFRLGAEDVAYIESADGVILASCAEDTETADALHRFLSAGASNADLIRQRINGKDMMISASQSAETGFSVVIARSAKTAYARLSKVHWIIRGSLAVSVLLGALFSYFFSRRSSALIKNLADDSAAQLNSMSFGKAFQSLRKTFDDIQTANDTLSQTLAAQQPYLQKSFLTQLLNGDFASEESALTVAQSLSAFHPQPPYRAVLIHYSGENTLAAGNMDLQLSMNCKAVVRLAVESLEDDALRMSWSESDYVLLLSGENLEERIEKLARLIRSNLPEGVNEFVYIYVGNPVTLLTEVVRSWNNASSMIYLQPSPAEVSVQYYQESQNARLDVFYPQDIQRRLINSVMNADTQSALDILNLLRERNRQGTAMPAYIAQLLIDSLLSTLLQIKTMSGLPPEKAEKILSGVKSLMTLPINTQMDMVSALYSDLCEAVRQLKSEGGKQQIIDEISVYIQEHYMDPDLSLTSVADRFHVSESYLSFTFKAQKGSNFFSFVESLRIARAKALLKQTNLKISEIAQQVGYASANSFCRAFKRSTGDSASSYRNGTESEDPEA